MLFKIIKSVKLIFAELVEGGVAVKNAHTPLLQNLRTTLET